MATWHIDPDGMAEPGFSPDGEPFPRDGYRLVRLRQVVAGTYTYTETEIPVNTPVDDELTVALASLE